MIELANITKFYESDTAVLDRVTATLAASKLHVITGKSGSGKSTLLNLIGGLDKPSAGIVIVGDKNVALLKGTALSAYRKSVGFIFQSFNLVPELTVLENVILPGLWCGKSRAALVAHGTNLLASLNLESKSNCHPKKLSGGEQQRTAIARALINRPQLILADEPTGNLDTQSSAQVVQLLLRLVKEAGTTVVVATHDTQWKAVSDTSFSLKDGILQ